MVIFCKKRLIFFFFHDKLCETVQFLQKILIYIFFHGDMYGGKSNPEIRIVSVWFDDRISDFLEGNILSGTDVCNNIYRRR